MFQPLNLGIRSRITAVVLSGSLLASAAAAADAPVARRKPADPMAPISDKPGVPRVLLIGDSISIGYTIPVRRQLDGIANVHRIPTNGGPTTNGLDQIDAWLGNGRWDVIHFNWGLHDLKLMKNGRYQVPIEQYEANLRQLVARLKRTGATLIWATTTPVPENVGQPPRKPGDVLGYNQAALRVMRENNIAVNDLYVFALPQLAKIQIPRNVHFTADGYSALAGPVAQNIRKALDSRRRAATRLHADTKPATTRPAARSTTR